MGLTVLGFVSSPLSVHLSVCVRNTCTVKALTCTWHTWSIVVLLMYNWHLYFTVSVCVWLLCSPVHRGRPSSVRAARWSHPRSCSAVAGWSSCAETACWSSTSLCQSPVALWPDSALNGTTPGEKGTRPSDLLPLRRLFFKKIRIAFLLR